MRAWPRVWLTLPPTAAAATPTCASPLHLEHLAVLNESRPVGERVVERPRGRIGLVRIPINPAGARRPRLAVDRIDQGAAESELARPLGHEQVLQIAIVADRPARAVIEVVHDAEQLAVDGGAEQPHRLVRI